RLNLPRFFAPKLRTKGYDFLITSDARPIAVSPGTIELMRYHDPIPMLHPDTMGHISPMWSHYRLTARAAGDGYFICNSEPTEHDLVRLFPKARGRTATIPCALAEPNLGDTQNIKLHDIAKVRLSGASLGQQGLGAAAKGILTAAKLRDGARYIMGLSTL